MKVGDIFQYKSKYSNTEYIGVVKSVGDSVSTKSADTFISDRNIMYKISEVLIITKSVERNKILDKLFK